eukprot:CAMPEP_0206598918 /NCGR_PEP_ID=MMETSP0325_2-20121206/44894_1 /ASSEMBLY_ACC=CAM_ASM_000347 /TAXON_ID=2866 /ORGANISM="Crypthecodinium cohnii, Strain Seligo" /LENGTH=146 /DNA_ID=CAMNT_0054109939 /DNA_START=6 /DNA_END=442 /DNA_ORIENTATION=-
MRPMQPESSRVSSYGGGYDRPPLVREEDSRAVAVNNKSNSHSNTNNNSHSNTNNNNSNNTSNTNSPLFATRETSTKTTATPRGVREGKSPPALRRHHVKQLEVPSAAQVAETPTSTFRPATQSFAVSTLLVLWVDQQQILPTGPPL